MTGVVQPPGAPSNVYTAVPELLPPPPSKPPFSKLYSLVQDVNSIPRNNADKNKPLIRCMTINFVLVKVMFLFYYSVNSAKMIPFYNIIPS